jgi:hypothetical protein
MLTNGLNTKLYNIQNYICTNLVFKYIIKICGI